MSWLISLAQSAMLVFLLCTAQINGKVRTAVILESPQLRTTHSEFFQILQDRGHKIDFFETNDDLDFEKYGERMFENLIVFAPHKNLPVSKDQLLEFIQLGGNIILSSSSKLTKTQREFALECGVEYEEKGYIVMDHIAPVTDIPNVEPSSSDSIFNSLIQTQSFVDSAKVVDDEVRKTSKPVWFNGLGMSLDPESVLGFSVLSAPPTAYSMNPSKILTSQIIDQRFLIGNDVVLVAAVQARNNARIIFSGSIDLFSNAYLKKIDENANHAFVSSLSKWAFQEAGVLRMTNIQHSRSDGRSPDKMLKELNKTNDLPITLYPEAEIARDSLVYRVKDNLTFSLDIHELSNGEWVPFDANDVQLEFVMLDPYVRTTMTSLPNSAKFTTTFTAPDAYGIYLFRVMYRRVGLSTLYSTTQVSLRPFKHDEFERFLPAAYPYYFSAFSMLIGVFLFSTFFLFHEDS